MTYTHEEFLQFKRGGVLNQTSIILSLLFPRPKAANQAEPGHWFTQSESGEVYWSLCHWEWGRPKWYIYIYMRPLGSISPGNCPYFKIGWHPMVLKKYLRLRLMLHLICPSSPRSSQTLRACDSEQNWMRTRRSSRPRTGKASAQWTQVRCGSVCLNKHAL